MKRLIASLIVLGSLTGWWLAAQAATPAANALTVAVIYREGGPPISISPTAGFMAPSPLQKGTALRTAFAQAKPGDLLIVGFGVYDFGKDTNVKLPSCTVRGMGKDHTRLVGEVVSDAAGTNFALSDTTVEDLTLQNDCWNYGEDGRCVGFDDGPHTAVIRRCRCWCRDWCIYNWTPGNRLTVEDSEIIFGRVGVACENSGDGQDVMIDNCRFYGDGSLSRSQGATSNLQTGGVFGVIARGGPCRIYNSRMYLKGWAGIPDASGAPRVCGVADKGGGGSEPSGDTRVTVYNLLCEITPTGSDPAKCFDLDFTDAWVRQKLRINAGNCWGSAGDGTMKKSW
jgi:hypothetical protein